MSAPLEALFDEVSFLALQLRQGVDLLAQDQEFSAGVRGLLQALGEGPQTVPQIAHHRRTSRQNIQIVVNRLLKSGLIESTTNPKHKRSALLTLTPVGKTVLERLEQRSQTLLRELAGQIGEADLSSAAEVIRKTRALLSHQLTTKALAQASDAPQGRLPREPSQKTRIVRPVPFPQPVERSEPALDEDTLPVNLL